MTDEPKRERQEQRKAARTALIELLAARLVREAIASAAAPLPPDGQHGGDHDDVAGSPRPGSDAAMQ